MNKDEITKRILRMVESHRACSFFLNGPPLAGKSYLLSELSTELPTYLHRSVVLGPYKMNRASALDLAGNIVNDFREAGFIDQIPASQETRDLVSIWRWLQENANLTARKLFVVLIDLNTQSADIELLCNLFSNARYLEGVFDSRLIRLVHVFVGHWDHPSMVRFFRKTNTSFPYTTGFNYSHWTGISVDDLDKLIDKYFPERGGLPFGRILHELTNGHPGAAIDILEHISSSKLCLPALLTATRKAALDGPTTQTLLQIWRKLPMDSKQVLRELILERRISATTLPAHLDRLNLAGITHRKPIGTKYYLEFRSWYVELAVRLHDKELEITSDQSERIEFEDLVPTISIMNFEAYRVIHEIENLARNVITVQMSVRSEPGFHYLMGRGRKFNQDKGVNEDAYKRAEDWKENSADRGLASELNPLIAFLSLRDLANLVETMDGEIHSTNWMRIAQMIRELSDVRDSVMHNQLIDDFALLRLYDLQADIYQTLSETI